MFLYTRTAWDVNDNPFQGKNSFEIPFSKVQLFSQCLKKISSSCCHSLTLIYERFIRKNNCSSIDLRYENHSLAHLESFEEASHSFCMKCSLGRRLHKVKSWKVSIRPTNKIVFFPLSASCLVFSVITELTQALHHMYSYIAGSWPENEGRLYRCGSDSHLSSMVPHLSVRAYIHSLHRYTARP